MLEWIPDRPALSLDEACSADLLIRITPPEEETVERRPDLNLSLVIDRSGSMGGEKIELTRQAAAKLVRALGPQDQLSIVLFDDTVDTLLNSTRVTDPARILALIEQIVVRGNTNLFGGWQAGANQVRRGLAANGLNRVLLLTDGQANVGQTAVDPICSEVHQVSRAGIQTTTLGFGDGYNEALLRSMAASGDGNQFYVQTGDQLSKFFAMELDGLAMTQGTQVRLRLHVPEGVTIEPMGDLVENLEGEYQLADIMAGAALEPLFRAHFPAGEAEDTGLRAELTWYSPKAARYEKEEVALRLPRVASEERAVMAFDPRVEVKLCVALAARARQQAMAAFKSGDKAQATRLLDAALERPNLPAEERSQLNQLKATLERGDQNAGSKLYAAQSYSSARSSVVLSSIHDQILPGMIREGNVPIALGKLFTEGYTAGHSPWEKRLGMLQGLFGGEARALGPGPPGEISSLAAGTFGALGGSRSACFLAMMTLNKRLAEVDMQRTPSEAFLTFQEKVRGGAHWLNSGALSPDCGAVARIAPVLLVRKMGVSGDTVVPACVLAAANCTHHDNASNASAMAFGGVLADLLVMVSPPDPEFYVSRFLELIGDLETGQKYTVEGNRYDGWQGQLSEFVKMVVEDARKRGLSPSDAHSEWGSGVSLFEAMPTVLYILECHAQPPVALRQALQGTSAPAPLGAMVGAALGALHGDRLQWEFDPSLTTALDELTTRLA